MYAVHETGVSPEPVVLVGEDGAPFFDRYRSVAFPVSGPIWPNNHIHVLRPNRRMIEARYLAYVLNSVDYSRYITGSTRDKLTQSQLGSIEINCPELVTQRRIADFLDRETARIDELIEKKEQLIKLLEEQLAGRITDALAQVANGGKLQGLRWLISVRSGDFLPNVELQTGPTMREPYMVMGGNGRIGFCSKWNVQGPVIIVGRVGALCGNVHLVTDYAWVTDNALVVQTRGNALDPVYLAEVLSAANLNEFATKSAQPLITGDTVKSLRVAIPDMTAQKRVVEKIRTLSEQHMTLEARCVKSINKLHQLRSTLVTSVVTGRLNVDTW